MTDFLVARTLETLKAASCEYFVAGDRVICNCETLAEPVEEALNEFSLVRWCDKMWGPENVVAAILADQYATHPDYDPEWGSFFGLG